MQIDDTILPSCTYLSKSCASCIEQLEYPPKYIADMFRNLAVAIIISFSEVKDKHNSL